MILPKNVICCSDRNSVGLFQKMAQASSSSASPTITATWNTRKLFNTFSDQEAAVNWSIEQGILPGSRICSRHRSPCSLKFNRAYPQGGWICSRGDFTRSVYYGSFFSEETSGSSIRLSLPEVYHLLYCWCYDQPIRFAMNETNVSSATVVEYYNYFNQLADQEISHTFSTSKIGGYGWEVQIDESKFGSRKYNVGRVVEGTWVLGMIARNGNQSSLRMIVCPNNSRSRETLKPLILQNIAPGSVIYTDCWQGYSNIEEMDQDFQHFSVNHTNNFVNPETGAHTNAIEGSWKDAKQRYKAKNVPQEKFQQWLNGYQWKRNIKKKKLDPFQEAVNLIKKFYSV